MALMKGDRKMMRMRVTNYVVHSPKVLKNGKSGEYLPFANAKKIEFLDEKRTEYEVFGVATIKEDFEAWMRAFYEMPDECTSIEEWEG